MDRVRFRRLNNAEIRQLMLPNVSSLQLTKGQGVVSFSRATTATYLNDSGALVTAASNEPRFTANGCLIEPLKTNLNTYSSTLTNSSFAKTNCSVAINAVAPDGTTTGCTITAISTAVTIFYKTITATSATHGLSFFTKKGSRASAKFLMRNNTTLVNFNICTFNYDTGVATGVGWSVIAYPNGWFKLSYTNSATQIINVGDSILVYYGAIGDVYTAGDSWVLWGLQIEESFTSSYIPTVSSTVTRNADVVTIPTTNNIKSSRCFVSFEFTPTHNSVGTVALFGIYVDANNSFQLLHTAGIGYILRKRIAQTNYDSTVSGEFISDVTYKITVTWGSGGTRLFVNGATAFNSNTAKIPLAATLQIGSDGNSLQQAGAYFKNINIGDKQLSTIEQRTFAHDENGNVITDENGNPIYTYS